MDDARKEKSSKEKSSCEKEVSKADKETRE